MMEVWCIAWVERKSGVPFSELPWNWCATFRGAEPSEDAVQDKTACGHYVTMRPGSERRKPTCPECIERVQRRQR